MSAVAVSGIWLSRGSEIKVTCRKVLPPWLPFYRVSASCCLDLFLHAARREIGLAGLQLPPLLACQESLHFQLPPFCTDFLHLFWKSGSLARPDTPLCSIPQHNLYTANVSFSSVAANFLLTFFFFFFLIGLKLLPIVLNGPGSPLNGTNAMDVSWIVLSIIVVCHHLPCSSLSIIMARSIKTYLLLWHSSWLPCLQHLLCNVVEVVVVVEDEVRMIIPLHLSPMIPLLCLPLKGALFVYSL